MQSLKPLTISKQSNEKPHYEETIIRAFVIFVFNHRNWIFRHAQTIYVKIRPAAPVVVRPVAPSPNHVWIAEEWRPNGGGYVYAGGYWAAPPKPGWIWIPGHWKKHEHGEYWVAGHWSH